MKKAIREPRRRESLEGIPQKLMKACFFCYKSVSRNDDDDDDGHSGRLGAIGRGSRFLELLERYLGFENGFGIGNTSSTHDDDGSRTDEINMILRKGISTFCEDCLIIGNQFGDLYDQLKCLELRLNWKVWDLRNIMRSSDRIQSRREDFSEALSVFVRDLLEERGDRPQLEHLELVKHFRNELVSKSSRKLLHFPRVSLKRYSSPKGPTLSAEQHKLTEETSRNKIKVLPGVIGGRDEFHKVVTLMDSNTTDTESPKTSPKSRAPPPLVPPPPPPTKVTNKDESEIASAATTSIHDFKMEIDEALSSVVADAESTIIQLSPDASSSNMESPSEFPIPKLSESPIGENTTWADDDDDDDEFERGEEVHDDINILEEQSGVQTDNAASTTITTIPKPTPENKSPIDTSAEDGSSSVPTIECPVRTCPSAPFTHPAELQAHSKRHGIFKCAFCSVIRSYAPDLAIHELEEHGVKQIKYSTWERSQYRCVRCDFKAQEKGRYVNHHLEEHLKVPSAVPCPFCLLPIKANLVGHIRLSHEVSDMEPSEVSRCDQCPAYFRTSIQLARHQARMHSTNPSLDSMKPFKCGDCGKEYLKRVFLRKHRLKKHVAEGDLQFPCDAEGCGKRYETKLELDLHQKCVHSSKATAPMVECPTCGKKGSQFGMRIHMRMHDPNWKPKKRMKRSESESVVVCDQCGVDFRNKADLKNHLLTHSGPSSWKFSCPACGKKCTTKYSLRDHLRTHTGEKPFVCSVCGVAYTYRHSLRTHVNKNHADVMEDKAKPMKKRQIFSKKGIRDKPVFDKKDIKIESNV